MIQERDRTVSLLYRESPAALQPATVILSGASGCGKTTACRTLAALAESRRLSVGGILTLPYFIAGRVVALEVQDVSTGTSRPLATLAHRASGTTTGRWRFDEDGLAWGATILGGCGGCDLLLIDELGSLELIQGRGWCSALDVLRAGQYRLAVVVVRSSLERHFRDALPLPDPRAILTLRVTPDNRNSLPRRILALAQERQRFRELEDWRIPD
jgi:nucleoside-triphosphatase